MAQMSVKHDKKWVGYQDESVMQGFFETLSQIAPSNPISLPGSNEFPVEVQSALWDLLQRDNIVSPPTSSCLGKIDRSSKNSRIASAFEETGFTGEGSKDVFVCHFSSPLDTFSVIRMPLSEVPGYLAENWRSSVDHAYFLAADGSWVGFLNDANVLQWRAIDVPSDKS